MRLLLAAFLGLTLCALTLAAADISGTWSASVALDAGKVVYKGRLDGAAKIKGSVEYGQLGKGNFTAEKTK
jgi:hypothetical protein